MITQQKPLSIVEIQEKATALRRHVMRMTGAAGSGHPGGSLSAADIVAVLYFAVLRHDPANPSWPDRDRFILSKGHAAPVLYAALAEAGYFPKELLLTLRQLGSPLQGHPAAKELPLLESSTGSLGQGLSIGVGMALAAKLDGKAHRVYVLLGDGEADEGQVWTAARSAVAHRLDNLTAILDYNKFQLDGPVAQIMSLEPLAEKWAAFGWHVREIDGHDVGAILAALGEAPQVKGRPSIIIAHTIKGKGVSFMENDNEFHGRAPTPEQVERALAELGGEERALAELGGEERA